MASSTSHHPQRSAVQAQRRLDRGGLELVAAGGDVTTLGALEARLWELCDGSRNVPAIAAILSAELGAEVGAEAVWRALDGLADAGLLQGRAAPPASPARLDRRSFLRRTWPGLAIAGAATVPGVAMAASVEEDAKLASEQSDKTVQQELTNKSAMEQANKQSFAQEQSNKLTDSAQEQRNKADVLQQEQADKLANEQSIKNSAQEQSNKADVRQQEQADKLANEQSIKNSAQEQDLKAINAEQGNKATEQQEKIGADQLAEQASKSSNTEMLAKSAAEQRNKGSVGGGGGTNPMPAPQTLLLFGAALAALAVTRYAGRADKPAPSEAADDQAAPGGK